jgi:methionyl-tRNA formyltransferase
MKILGNALCYILNPLVHNISFMKKIRTLLMGTPQLAADIFESILTDERFDVVGIVSQPDKPVGRKQELRSTQTKKIAQKHDIAVFQPERASRKSFVKQMVELDIDVAFVVAYGQILKQRFLDIPKYGCVNLHGSLLPLYRGASPIQAALLHGNAVSGISYIKMDVSMDSGDVIQDFEVNIGEHDKMPDLATKLIQIGKETVADVLCRYVSGTSILTAQNHDQASYCHKIEKTDGCLNPIKMNMNAVYNTFRAYTPWPGITIEWNEMNVKLIDIMTQSLVKSTADTLFVFDKQLYLSTTTKAIHVKMIQLPGKKAISGLDFINSYLI